MVNKYSTLGVECERCGETVNHYYGFASELFYGPVCLTCRGKEQHKKLLHKNSEEKP